MTTHKPPPLVPLKQAPNHHCRLRLVALYDTPHGLGAQRLEALFDVQQPGEEPEFFYCFCGGVFAFEPADIGQLFDVTAKLGAIGETRGRTVQWLSRVKMISPSARAVRNLGFEPAAELGIDRKAWVQQRAGVTFVNFSSAETDTASTVGWDNEFLRRLVSALFPCVSGEHLAAIEVGPRGITAHRSIDYPKPPGATNQQSLPHTSDDGVACDVSPGVSP